MRKKPAALLLALLLSGIVLFAACAQTDQMVSIKTLRETTPQVWTQTYQTAQGTEVTIYTDIDLPKVDSFPILQVAEGNRSLMLRGDSGATLVDFSQFTPGAFREYLNAPDGIWNERGEKKNKPEWKNAATGSIYWMQPWQMERAYAEDNPATLFDAQAFFQRRIEQLTDGALSFSLDAVLTKGVYTVSSWSGQTPTLGSIINQGYYELLLTQDLNGIPALAQAHAKAVDHNQFKGDSPPCPRPGSAEIMYGNDQEYTIACPARTPGARTWMYTRALSLGNRAKNKQAIRRLL